MFILKTDSCGYLDSDSVKADFSYSTDTTNQTIAFTNQSSGYCTSFWYFGDGDSSTVPNPTHSYGDTGIYIVTLVVRAGNSLDTTSYTVNTQECMFDGVNALFQYTQDSSDIYTISFSNQSQDYCSLKWFFGTGDSSFTANPNYTFSDTGTYTITLIAFAGIYSDTFSQEIKIEEIGVGISSIPNQPSSIKVYPNPTGGVLYFEVNRNTTISKIDIIDLQGKMLHTSNQNAVNTSELPSGIYLYQVYLENGTVVRGKFVRR